MDCFRRAKLISQQNFITLIKSFGAILEVEKLCLISKEIHVWYTPNVGMVGHESDLSPESGILVYQMARCTSKFSFLLFNEL